MEKKENAKCIVIGALILTIASIDFVIGLKNDPLKDLLWFSNTILFVLGLAYLLRSKLIAGSVLISSIAEVPWVIDFIGHLFFGRSAFGGVTDYMFSFYGTNSLRFFIELDHLLIIPLAIYGAYKIGVHKKSYLFSSAHAILIVTLTFFFSTKEENINCIYRLCFLKTNPLPISETAYVILFTVSLCCITYLENAIIIRILDKKN